MAMRLATMLFIVTSLLTTQVRADAEVRVRVEDATGQAADGKVTLESASESAKRFSCTTQKGSCTIKGVPGGQYLVVFSPAKGSSTKPRKVMIPPNGQVKLRVAAD